MLNDGHVCCMLNVGGREGQRERQSIGRRVELLSHSSVELLCDSTHLA
jgi:hypothetical protein